MRTITPVPPSMPVRYVLYLTSVPLLLPCPLRLVQVLLVWWHSQEELSTTELLGREPTDDPTPHYSQSPHNAENIIHDPEN